MGSFFQKKTTISNTNSIEFFYHFSVEMVKRVKRNTRKGRRSSRRSRRQRGGWQNLSPADLSAAQGTDYKNIHKGQYGGGSLEGAPVGTTGVLDESLRATARVSTLDNSMSAIQGMSDQSCGGRRGRRSRRKHGGSRCGMRGGAQAVDPADYSAPTHLLSAGAEAKALMQMSPEWKLAENPLSFAPKMSGGKRGKRGSRRRRGSRRH